MTQDGSAIGLRDLDITTFVEALCMADATDLHLKVGAPPRVRIDGDLHPLNVDALEDGDMYRLAREAMPPDMWTGFQTGHYGDVDFAYEVAGVGRFRVNCFRQRGTIELVLRRVPAQPPSLDRLALPAGVLSLIDRSGGLVLLAGPSRGGKTTTMAAMVAALNASRRVHILTIENPIEYVFHDDLASISQRSVRADSGDVHDALRAALRQDPDVLCVADVCDRAAMDAVLHAAGAGILVLATMEGDGVEATLERTVSWFPPREERRVRRLLARHLQGVLSQRLLPGASAAGKVPAVEVLLRSDDVVALLRDGDLAGLGALMAADDETGMQTFDQSLASLVLQGEVDPGTAAAAAVRRADLARVLAAAGVSLP